MLASVFVETAIFKCLLEQSPDTNKSLHPFRIIYDGARTRLVGIIGSDERREVAR
jgi:hypothetical protein